MIRAVAVVVPVHDEAELLPSCLEGLGRAVSRLPSHVHCRTVVVLDACRDASEDIARGWARAPWPSVVRVDYRSVGRSRRHGVLEAMQDLAAFDARHVWLASTDADSVVPPKWLVSQLRMAKAGVEAFAGTVRVDDWRAHPRGFMQAFRAFYEAHGTVRAHRHVHGANIGVRADAYLASGGFPPLVTGEDHALWDALGREGRRRLASRRLAVRTSARLHARAPDGFSVFLRQFSERDVDDAPLSAVG